MASPTWRGSFAIPMTPFDEKDRIDEEVLAKEIEFCLESHVGGMAFAKEIMVRRGIFKNHRMRSQSRPLDASDRREIDKTWERIQPYLIWHK